MFTRLQIPGLTPEVVPDSIPSVKEELEMLRTLPFDELVNKVVNTMVTFTINLAIAILVFYVGKFIIKKIHNFLSAIMISRRVDKSLSTFLLSFVRAVLYFLLVITVIGILGIETSSFIALFASAGVAIGMALSGTLQNFAGGVLVLLLKPYKVGDYIEAQGYSGTVKEIQIFHTIILTPDNKSIIIPNGGLSTSSINNFSREDYRRVDWTVSISYGDSVDDARRAILEIIDSDDRIVKKYVEDDRSKRFKEMQEALLDSQVELPEQKTTWVSRIFGKRRRQMPKVASASDSAAQAKAMALLPKTDRSPIVKLSALADSSVNLTVRAWTLNSYYWAVFFDINERIYNELPQHGISFPFPQLDVHMQK